MRDARTPEGVWVKDAQVFVEGDASAKADRSTWTKMVILEVRPFGAPFRIGWRTDQFTAAEFYSEPAETIDGMLAMMVGDKGVWFVARPVDGRTQLTIERVASTHKDYSRYRHIPHY